MSHEALSALKPKSWCSPERYPAVPGGLLPRWCVSVMGTRLDPWLRMAHGFVRSAAPNRVGYLLTSRAPSAKLCYPSLSRGGTVADYIQIVEYESDDIDAVIRTAN